MGLVDIHEQLSSYDSELEKEAAVEYEKLAEEDAAGRIMARGFMDELQKIAGGLAPITPGQTVKSKPYDTSAGAQKAVAFGGGNKNKMVSPKATKAPSSPDTMNMKPMQMAGSRPVTRTVGLPRPRQ